MKLTKKIASDLPGANQELHQNSSPEALAQAHSKKQKLYRDLSEEELFERRIRAMAKAEEVGTNGRRTIALFEMNVNDRFAMLQKMVAAVAAGLMPGMIIAGSGGIGKTYTVLEVLTSAKDKDGKPILKEGRDFMLINNRVSARQLYEEGLKFRHKGVIILDDTTTWSDDHKALIKAMCDTVQPRRVNWRTKAHDQVDATPDQAEKMGKIPKEYEFNGRLIVITNLTEDKIDHPILSRCTVLPLALTDEEKLIRMRTIAPKMNTKMDLGFRMEILDELIKQSEREHRWKEDKRLKNTQINELCLRTLKKTYDFFEGQPHAQREDWKKWIPILL